MSRQSCVIGEKFVLIYCWEVRTTWREGYVSKKCADLFTVYVIRGRREKSVVDGNNRA